MSEPVPPIGTQISALAALAPDEPAVTCDGLTITRAELDRSTNRLARAYAERGVGVGDYVTMVLPNSVEWIQAAVACWKLGAVPQPLSARLPAAELEGLLQLRPPALLVGHGGDRRLGEAGRSGSPTGQPSHPDIPSVPIGFIPDATLSDAALPEAVSPVWKAMGSGGSTGRPKLIESGGPYFGSRIPAAIGYPLGAQEGDTTLVPVPLSHNTGFTTATIALLMRQHLVLMSRFDPHRFLQLITDHRVTFLTTVPTIMQRTLPVYQADPHSYDLSSIRRFWHLAAPCPPAIKQAWIDLLGPEKVWELYGGTELQALTFISGDQWLTHRGSVGVVVAGEMKVLDDEGNPCPPGVVGEIYMRPNPGSAPTYRYVGARQKAARAGIRWAISATSTPTVSCICRTGGSTCSPSAAAMSTPPRSKAPCRRTRMCCPAWSLASRTRTPVIWVRCPTRWCRRPTTPPWTPRVCRTFCATTSRATRCRPAPTSLNSSTLPCATTPARPGDRRSGPRSWRDR
ncbi:MAG: bile acid-coenzyme ligase [Mycobacterium sp.]|nr:bile acid-coenzyme ligase [Mycobacterium sp.]